MTAPLFAQDQTKILFEIIDTEYLDKVSKARGVLSVQPIEFNKSVLNEIGSKQLESFQVPLSADNNIDVSIQKIIHFNNGGWSALGFVNHDSINSFVLSYFPSTGKVISSIQDVTDHSFYEVRFSNNLNQHVLAEKDPHQSDELACGHNHDFTIESDAVQSQKNRSNIEPLQEHGPSTIDVLIAYTPQALDWANANSSGINNIINQSMATAQLIADISNVNVQFNLVHSQIIEYQETGNSTTDLRRLTASPTFNPWGPENAGYMDEIHQIRNAYAADLVAFSLLPRMWVELHGL